MERLTRVIAYASWSSTLCHISIILFATNYSSYTTFFKGYFKVAIIFFYLVMNICSVAGNFFKSPCHISIILFPANYSSYTTFFKGYFKVAIILFYSVMSICSVLGIFFNLHCCYEILILYV